MKAPSGKHRNLVLVRAGPHSLHPSWMAPSEDEQAFDLIVLAYGPTFLAPERSDFGHVDLPGFKVAGYGAFFSQYRHVLEKYDRVALIDDDIATDSKTLAKAFEVGEELDLDIWQPSLSLESYFSYSALLSWPGAKAIRRVNFVEMMCPFFKTTALLEVEDLFHIGAETAIDIFWSCILGRRPGALAVLNDVTVTHTRPVGKLKAMNGFDDKSKGYSDEIGRLLAELGVSHFGGAIPLSSLNGTRHSPMERIESALSMLRVVKGATITPMRLRQFFWVIAVDLRKVLFESARIPGDPDRLLAEAKRLRRRRELPAQL